MTLAKIVALKNELANVHKLLELRDEEIDDLKMKIKMMEKSHEDEIFDLCEEIACLQTEKEEIEIEAESVKQQKEDLLTELEEAEQKVKRLKFVLSELSPPPVSRRGSKGCASQRPKLPTILEEDEDEVWWPPVQREPVQRDPMLLESSQLAVSAPPIQAAPSAPQNEKTRVPGRIKKSNKHKKFRLLYTFASI